MKDTCCQLHKGQPPYHYSSTADVAGQALAASILQNPDAKFVLIDLYLHVILFKAYGFCLWGRVTQLRFYFALITHTENVSVNVHRQCNFASMLWCNNPFYVHRQLFK